MLHDSEFRDKRPERQLKFDSNAVSAKNYRRLGL